jgi:hypothetical protein
MESVRFDTPVFPGDARSSRMARADFSRRAGASLYKVWGAWYSKEISI